MEESKIIRKRLGLERGVIYKRARYRVALLKPSRYYVSMSSLGYQQVYSLFNSCEDFAAERCFFPDSGEKVILYESGALAANADIIAVSIAYELEIPDFIRCLLWMGLEPLRENRRGNDPLIVIGGPLSFSNIESLGSIGDCFILGEGEGAIEAFCACYREAPGKAAFLEHARSRLPWLWQPAITEKPGDSLLWVHRDVLPAKSAILSPDTEFADCFLIEAERGCHRRCKFCVMRREGSPGMRIVQADKLLSLIPEEVSRIGLVGAAVSDHPQLCDIVENLVDKGKFVSLSSLRTDKLNKRLLDALIRSGLKSLTIAADGPSERLRKSLTKDVSLEELCKAAAIARESKMRVKIYVMIGLPDEEDQDIIEFAEFVKKEFKGMKPSLGVSPFVSKRRTPLSGLPFAGIKVVESRVRLLRKLVGQYADIGEVSARTAFLEHAFAQGGQEMGRIAVEVVRGQGTFKDWKRLICR